MINSLLFTGNAAIDFHTATTHLSPDLWAI